MTNKIYSLGHLQENDVVIYKEGTIERKEHCEIDGFIHLILHSDYFIDFVKEEFGGIKEDSSFNDLLLRYEMYFDVVGEFTRYNFKKRFILEKYWSKEDE